MATIYTLKAGSTLAVTANEGRVHVRSGDDGSESAFTRSAVSFGPFRVDRTFLVDGDATVTTTRDTTPTNRYMLANAGAPDDALQAAANVNPTGNDNGLTFTAVEYGTSGNDITVEYVDPGANSQSLAVSVTHKRIIVSLATNGGGSITSTAAQVLAAVNAHIEAGALVTATVYTADSGTADDGSGVVTAMAAASLSGGAGTGIGVLAKGGLLVDTTNGYVYRNSGTQAVPVYTKLGDAA